MPTERTSDPASETLARARVACDARDWAGAYEILAAAPDREELSPEALELLSECARWTGNAGDIVDPLERAHTKYVARDDRRGAVRTALALSQANGDASRPAVAAAWWKRADSLIALLPEGPEHALHAWFASESHAWSGDSDSQERYAERALDLARRYADRDVEALALINLAHVATLRGEPTAIELLEQAVSLALGGEIGILASGTVFCNAIWASRCRGEWQRAEEWTESATRWVTRQGVDYFPAMCRVHRAEVLRIRGQLAAAEAECEAATRQVLNLLPSYAIFPWAELGEIRRRRGDHSGALAAFQKALELGWDPQPGLALLLLARGDSRSALRSLERVVLEPRPTWLREDRANLLAARVVVAVAAGESELAAKAVAELEELKSRNETDWNRAAAAYGRGILELAAGRADSAVEHLTRARRSWGRIDAPYELATTGLELGKALALEGDATGARIELEAAREVFARIGAEVDRKTCETELERLDAPSFAAAPSRPGSGLQAEVRASAAMRREGETWAITFRGRTIRLKHSRGLVYLATLLARPGTECWAVDLAGMNTTGGAGDAGELIDGEARAAYRRRAEELEEELRELDPQTDPLRAEQIRMELDAIGTELAAAVGLGGRSRRAGSLVEKARQSVTKAIRSTVRRIDDAHPELGRYFEVTVKTGTACRFDPRLREPVEWSIEDRTRRRKR